MLIEEVRAYLREVGETALLEARRLKRDLIGENLAAKHPCERNHRPGVSQ